eukprot:10160873-Heterocapsa_arctica.AAC.1
MEAQLRAVSGVGRPSSGAAWLAKAPPVKAAPTRPFRPQGKPSPGPETTAARSRSPAIDIPRAKAAPAPRRS